MSVEIIVNDKPIRVYQKDGKNYVEGRKGSEFSIKITNPYGFRVLAIPSVDGLSTISGEAASSDSNGYVLSPYQSITIPGWKLDNSEVAKFVFSDQSSSYAATSDTPNVSNVGVIGVMFVSEKEKPSIMLHDVYFKGITRSPYQTIMYNSTSVMNLGTTISASAATSSYSEPEEKLGTGFGNAKEFRTREVEFERGSILDTISVFYDSKQNLIKKGVIKITPEEKTPNPFPGTGCKPPKSWKR